MDIMPRPDRADHANPPRRDRCGVGTIHVGWDERYFSRKPSNPQPLDPLDFFGLQAEVEDVEVGPHVAGVGGAGQGHHADVEGEPEDDLG